MAKPIAFANGTTVMAYGAGTMQELQIFSAPLNKIAGILEKAVSFLSDCFCNYPNRFTVDLGD